MPRWQGRSCSGRHSGNGRWWSESGVVMVLVVLVVVVVVVGLVVPVLLRNSDDSNGETRGGVSCVRVLCVVCMFDWAC